MPGKPRDFSKEHFWRRVVARWQQSDWSVAAFCAEESLEPCAFYWWRRELGRS
jgi:hypothetical protein